MWKARASSSAITGGPAVFGLLRPVIILPRWLLNAPTGICRIAIEHEREHLAARDQLALLAGLVAVVLAPWNVGLWWQLRRLRFAIEVDCDARVLSRGVEVDAYGAALLSVSQRSTGALVGALALTEPPSDLEKRIRIMLRGGRRHATLAIAAGLALSASLIAAAATIDVPVGRESLRYPLPQPLTMLNQIEAHARNRFPEYFSSPPPQPVLIRMLLNNDLSIETASATLLDPDTPFDAADDPNAPNNGVDPRLLAPGDPRMSFRYIHDTPQRRHVYMSAVVRVAADPTRIGSQGNPAIERALLEQHFPEVAADSAQPHSLLWFLIDEGGAVARTGRSANTPSQLRTELESTLGIGMQKFHVTEVGPLFGRRIVDSHGEPVMAAFTWFNPELQSAVPKTDLILDVNVYRNGDLVQSGPLSLAFGNVRSNDIPNTLRIEVTARSVDTDSVVLQTSIKVPAQHAADSADAWETVAQPVVQVRYDTEAVIEQGVRHTGAVLTDGKDAEVWRITLKPWRT